MISKAVIMIAVILGVLRMFSPEQPIDIKAPSEIIGDLTYNMEVSAVHAPNLKYAVYHGILVNRRRAASIVER